MNVALNIGEAFRPWHFLASSEKRLCANNRTPAPHRVSVLNRWDRGGGVLKKAGFFGVAHSLMLAHDPYAALNRAPWAVAVLAVLLIAGALWWRWRR